MRANLLKGAIAGSVFTLAVTSSAVALAGTGVGGVFNLGQTNTVNKTTKLAGATSASMLRVANTGAGTGASRRLRNRYGVRPKCRQWTIGNVAHSVS